MSLKEQGNFEEAVEALEKALSLEPRNADWHSTLGSLLWCGARKSAHLSHWRER